MAKKVMIYLDKEHPYESAQLLGIAEKAYKDAEVVTYAVGCVERQQVEDWFDCLILLEEHEWSNYDARRMADELAAIHQEYQFDCVIIPATWMGRMLAPVLAVKLNSGLTADITDVIVEDGRIQMIRPAFSGKLMAGIESRNSEVLMMSARLGVFTCKAVRKQMRLLERECIKTDRRTIMLTDVRKKEVTADIREAKVLVSGGGGVGNRFWQLSPLAEELNGMVSASRKIVDKAIAPRSIQVGQSGKIVSPQLYIALGIYGSMQHVEGLKDIPYIISVNTNRNAPICSLSDIVVESDAIEFTEKLLERLKNNKEE